MASMSSPAVAFVTPSGGIVAPPTEQATQSWRSVAAARSQESLIEAAASPSAGSSPWVGLALATGSVLAATRLLPRHKALARSQQVVRPAFDASSELGVQAPLGFWDPLGLSKSGDEATFKRRRAVEIKHGRVAMLATIGYIVPEYFKWPGYLSPSLGIKFEDVPNGLAAFSKLPVQGGAQIVAFAGFMETTGFNSGEAKNIGFQRCATMAGEPGNYGVGFPTWAGKVADPELRKKKLSAELANGRLAMMAIIGMFFQDGLTGSAWGDWALYDASPLR